VLFTPPDLRPNELATLVFIKAPPARGELQAAAKTLFERFGYKLVEAQEPKYGKSANGWKSLTRNAIVEGAEGKPLRAAQIALRKDGRLAVFMFAASPEVFARYRMAFALLMSSMRVGDSATVAGSGQREAPPTEKGDKPGAPAGESAPDKSQPPPALAPPPQSAPKTAGAGVELGHYACTSNIIRQYEVQESKPGISFDMFPDGTYWTDAAKDEDPPPRGILNWPRSMGRFKVEGGRLFWLSGPLSERGFANGHVPFGDGELWSGQIGRSQQGKTSIVTGMRPGVFADFCEHAGPSNRPTAKQVIAALENPESYLRPKAESAKPAPEAGKLEGLYTSGGQYAPTIYFSKSGKAFRGVYRWGFDTIDCERIGKPGKPFEGKPICRNYRIGANTIQFDNEEPEAFAQEGEGRVRIGRTLFIYVPPEKNLRLSGIYAHYTSVATGAGMTAGKEAFSFTQDGKFIYPEEGATGTHFGGESTYIAHGDDDPKSGTYRIDGYHIDFTTVSGLTLRYSFFRPPDGGLHIVYTGFLPKQK
jgi:hypothetical protein